MGLFSRDNRDNTGSDFLDEVDLPSSSDLNDDVFSNDEKSLNFNNSAKASPRQPVARKAGNNIGSANFGSGGYGIEDAIKLMRSLPRDNNEIVVTVVKKTLESTNIEVSDIIGDADAKESRIRDQHKTLETEIKELQEQIALRNQQITELLKDLKETSDVRQRLQLALDLDRKNAPAEKPEAEAKPVSEADNSNDAAVAPQQTQESDSGPDSAVYNGGPGARRRSERGASPQN